MKKILHISKYYYPYAGGIEDVCYNIVKLLQCEEQYDQQVFCFNDTKDTIRDQYEHIAVHRVGIKRVIASQPISFCYKRELALVLNEFNPEVVHFHAPNPLAAYYLLKVLPKDVKLIVHWHSDIVAQSIIYRFIKPIETKLLKRADVIIATSPNYIEGSQQLQKFKDKVVVIQNVIDPQKFKLTEQCQTQIEQIKDKYNHKPIVLFVGRHVQYKGLKYLIEVAPIIKSDCTIVIGGQGPLTEQLKSQNHSTKVKFIGRIDDELLSAYYHAADIFAFPSLTRNEAFGVSLAEAMYCQTPAITFTIKGSGVNWVNLDDQTGFEVKNSTALQLAKAIDELIENESLRDRLAKQAKERVEELFIIDKIKESLLNIYRNE